MPAPLPDASLEQVFTRARTFGRFTAWTVNFLVNLGYGDDAGTHPRAERLAFDEAVRVL